jgi:hypothetical protein
VQASLVSALSIYSICQAKRGVLLGLMDEALTLNSIQLLLNKGRKKNTLVNVLKLPPPFQGNSMMQRKLS